MKYKELLEDEDADEDDKDEYTACNVFFVPEEARWSYISKNAKSATIGEVIDNAMRLIEKENSTLKDILPKDYNRRELDKKRLGDVVEIFSNVEMSSDYDEQDVLGRVYEYCLQQFASQEGKNAGEFYTPRSIVKLMVQLLAPKPGDSVYEIKFPYLIQQNETQIAA